MKNNNPKITVLMPVYNAELFLRDAIQSILAQSFTDFEFIIINDYSTDFSKAIISEFKDTRIKVLENSKNLGISASLNRGIAESKGQYIARMDADDIAFLSRFKKQVDFLEKHQKVSVVGSSVIWIDNKGNKLSRKKK